MRDAGYLMCYVSYLFSRYLLFANSSCRLCRCLACACYRYAKMANGINFSFPPNGARGPFYVLERKFERTDARTEEGTTEHKTSLPRLLRYYIPSI